MSHILTFLHTSSQLTSVLETLAAEKAEEQRCKQDYKDIAGKNTYVFSL